MRKVNFRIISVMTALAAMLIAPQARAAADLVFGLGTTFNGTAPSSSGPWLTADFHTVAAGTVTLTLTLSSSFQNSGQFISDFAFNINSSFLPSGVTVTSPTGITVAHTTDNGQKTPPGFGSWKGWDFDVSFPTSAGNRFSSGSVVITLTAPGLTAQDFNFLNSSTANGQLSLFAGAHVQGIPTSGGGTTSGAIGTPVPEASTLIAGAGALGLLLLGIGLNSRRSGVIRIGK